MKLGSDVSVLRLTHEGIINFTSLSNFDKNIIENFPSVYENSIPVLEADVNNIIIAEAFVAGYKLYFISKSRILTSVRSENFMAPLPVWLIPKT